MGAGHIHFQYGSLVKQVSWLNPQKNPDLSLVCFLCSGHYLIDFCNGHHFIHQNMHNEDFGVLNENIFLFSLCTSLFNTDFSYEKILYHGFLIPFYVQNFKLNRILQWNNHKKAQILHSFTML